MNTSLAGASRRTYMLYAIHVNTPCLRACVVHECNGLHILADTSTCHVQLLARRPDLEIPWEKSKYRTFRFISVVGSKAKPSINCVMLSTGRSGAIPDAGSKARPKVLSKDAQSPSESHVSPALCAALEKICITGAWPRSRSLLYVTPRGAKHI